VWLTRGKKISVASAMISPNLNINRLLFPSGIIVMSAVTRHLRNCNASQNAGLPAAVSDRALIIAAAFDESFAHEGTSPIEPETLRDRRSWDSA
jgi:hypothetical protein